MKKKITLIILFILFNILSIKALPVLGMSFYETLTELRQEHYKIDAASWMIFATDNSDFYVFEFDYKQKLIKITYYVQDGFFKDNLLRGSHLKDEPYEHCSYIENTNKYFVEELYLPYSCKL